MLSPEFKTELAHVAKVMRPFVHWCVVCTLPLRALRVRADVAMHPTGVCRDCSLNDLMTIQDASDSSDSDSGGEEDDGDPDES